MTDVCTSRVDLLVSDNHQQESLGDLVSNLGVDVEGTGVCVAEERLDLEGGEEQDFEYENNQGRVERRGLVGDKGIMSSQKGKGGGKGGGRTPKTRSSVVVFDFEAEFPIMKSFTPTNKLPDIKSVVGLLRYWSSKLCDLCI